MKGLAIILLSVLLFSQDNFACTVFYICRDGVILGGSNEDWKDPNTRIWFYPGTGEKYGWVKFGFSGGFPQAGMNENGIFWDGTSNPWQDMPYSEANKEKLSSPIMQKVMEECCGIDEVEAIFNNYYYEDQYRGQYLIGSAEGRSVIVDGDYLHNNEYAYQVLTNFHQSNPDLGGYPCLRYEKAMSMLDSCSVPSLFLMGSILEATHQKGTYPTQYSLIFDPQQKGIYVFYYHSFAEYLYLNTDECLEHDTVSYHLPSVFSKVEMIWPENGTVVFADSAVIQWKGKAGSTFELCVRDNTGKQLVSKTLSPLPISRRPGMYYWTAILIPLLGIFSLRKKTYYLLLILLLLFFTACKKEEVEQVTDQGLEYRFTVRGLEPGHQYSWYVKAFPGDDIPLFTETIPFTFYCE